MWRSWYLVSMDSAQLERCGPLSQFLDNGHAGSLVQRFAVPVKLNSVQMSCATKFQNDNPRTKLSPIQKDLKPSCQIKSYLDAIPNELIQMIFHSLDALSCFRLSLVSKRFWMMGWPLFQQKIADQMNPWAGTRVICLGDQCEPNDCPANFLTKAEEDMVNMGLKESELDPENDIESKPGTLLSIAAARFDDIEGPFTAYSVLRCTILTEPKDILSSSQSQSRKDWYIPLDEISHLPKLLRHEVRKFAFEGKESDWYPKTESWILRNLTTAEFVVGDELSAAFYESKCENGLYLEFPGFGDAIMSRICWPSKDSTGLFNRGVWAGHRFEICIEKVHASKSGTGWKNVTSEIIEELSVGLEVPTVEMRKKTENQKSDVVP